MIKKPLVKICGLSTPETITAAIEAGADFIGFVFYPASPRHVEIEVAKYLCTQIPDHIEIVGLFVNPNDPTLQKVINEVPLTMIQLHGNERPSRVAEIKEHFKLPLIKAFSIENKNDLDKAFEYEGLIEWYLFDAKGEALPGGNGISFDWSILENYKSEIPWMLAGGLTPENVNEALKTTTPNAVDVSSGVESSAGVKDASKIRAFLKAVKQA
jgi:phosphoribosylanthranilate isomerase